MAYNYHKLILLLVSLFASITLFVAITDAQENPAWEPPTPPADTFDWIQLTSGEWLKGEFKDLYDNELEFDSDKLDLQVFDWEDVKRVRSPRIFSVRILGSHTVFGSLDIDEQKVIVTIGEEKKDFDRNQLIAIAPAGEKERDFWSGKISAGVNYSRGNTEQTQYNASLTVKRSTSNTRLLVDYFGNISETKGDRTADSTRVQGQFDIFKTRKYYFRPIFGEYYRDPLKNIEYKITAGCGMGYYFINTSKTEWEIGAGPGYQATRYKSVEQGEDDTVTSPSFLGGTRFNTELTDDIDFIFNHTFQIVNETSGTYTHHAVTSLEIELTDSIDFNISFIWDRVQSPQPDAAGNVPDKDDFNLLFGLGIEF